MNGGHVLPVVSCRHLDDVHVPSERSMAQLHVQMEIINQLEVQVGYIGRLHIAVLPTLQPTSLIQC